MQHQRDMVEWLRSPDSEIRIEDEEIWPKLPSDTIVRHLIQRNVCISQLCTDESSTERHETHISLDNAEYPKLGVKMIKYKNPALNECHSSYRTDSESCTRERDGRCGRQYKRTEKIHINLQELLENARCVKNSHGKGFPKLNFPWVYEAKIIKTCKGNVSVTIKHPYKDKEIEFRKVRTCVAKPKDYSRLKQIILINRDIKANMRKLESEQMDVATKEINDNFDALKISTGSEPDVNYIKRLSELSLYDKNYRNPKQENITDGSVQDRPDITDKFNKLFIKKTQEKPPINWQNPVEMCVDECDIAEKTRRLKINDDVKQENTNFLSSDIKIEPIDSQNLKE